MSMYTILTYPLMDLPHDCMNAGVRNFLGIPSRTRVHEELGTRWEDRQNVPCDPKGFVDDGMPMGPNDFLRGAVSGSVPLVSLPVELWGKSVSGGMAGAG